MSFVGGFFFFKQKTAYEMRISDWSSDVCSSDLGRAIAAARCADTVDGGEAALVSGMAHGWRPGSDVAGRPRRGERFSLCVVGDRWNGCGHDGPRAACLG